MAGAPWTERVSVRRVGQAAIARLLLVYLPQSLLHQSVLIAALGMVPVVPKASANAMLATLVPGATKKLAPAALNARANVRKGFVFVPKIVEEWHAICSFPQLHPQLDLQSSKLHKLRLSPTPGQGSSKLKIRPSLQCRWTLNKV
jgi:hypothetical protein